MHFSRDIIFFVSTLGWFNGVILAVYLIMFFKKRTIATQLLGWMIMALSLRVFKSVLWWFTPTLPPIYIQCGIVACMFVGPLLYAYLQASVHGHTRLSRNWVITLMIYILTALVLLLLFTQPKHIPFWKYYIIPAIYYQWFLYILLSILLITPKIKQFRTSKSTLSPNDKWQLTIVGCSTLIALGYALPFFGFKSTPYITGPIVFSLLIYLGLLIRSYRNNTEELIQSEPEKYLHKKIDPTKAHEKIQVLQHLMEEKEIYLQPDLKLSDLASLIDLSPHQLSQLLNDNLNKSFNTYINEFRIQKACDWILEKQELKLESVGYEVGFNSKSSFFTAFKKKTGVTPKAYKHQIEMQNASKSVTGKPILSSE